MTTREAVRILIRNAAANASTSGAKTRPQMDPGDRTQVSNAISVLRRTYGFELNDDALRKVGLYSEV